jgi:hypothetical protein
MPNAMPHDQLLEMQINQQSDQYADKKVHLLVGGENTTSRCTFYPSSNLVHLLS